MVGTAHPTRLRHIRFHDMRHTFATLLIAQGENIKFIQNQMGHASIQTTLDRYGHLLPESHNEVGSRLDKMVGIKVGASPIGTILTQADADTVTG